MKTHRLGTPAAPSSVGEAPPNWRSGRLGLALALLLATQACAGDDTATGPTYTPVCGNQICEAGESGVCTDCSGGGGGGGGGGGEEADCGNNRCEAGETRENCELDCATCGDGVCNGDEARDICPRDCAACGDGFCDGDETRTNCEADCAECGDGVCDADESPDWCPGDCGEAEYCGNGVCDAGESGANCVDDCGCDESANCEDDEVCVFYDYPATPYCEPAYSRFYDLSPYEGFVADALWDTVGAPDPRVSVFINDELLCSSDTVDNSNAPYWDESSNCETYVEDGDTVTVLMEDVDVTVHDQIALCSGPITLGMLRGNRIYCEADDGSWVELDAYPVPW